MRMRSPPNSPVLDDLHGVAPKAPPAALDLVNFLLVSLEGSASASARTGRTLSAPPRFSSPSTGARPSRPFGNRLATSWLFTAGGAPLLLLTELLRRELAACERVVLSW